MAFNTFLKIIGQLWDSDLVGPVSRCEQGCVLCWRTQLRVHYPPVPILSGCLPSLPVAPSFLYTQQLQESLSWFLVLCLQENILLEGA